MEHVLLAPSKAADGPKHVTDTPTHAATNKFTLIERSALERKKSIPCNTMFIMTTMLVMPVGIFGRGKVEIRGA